jgi:hypothetical protein
MGIFALINIFRDNKHAWQTLRICSVTSMAAFDYKKKKEMVWFLKVYFRFFNTNAATTTTTTITAAAAAMMYISVAGPCSGGGT